MSFTINFILTWFATFFIGLILTPLVRLLAFKIGAVDTPNERRINKTVMPSAGGLAIFSAFTISTLLILPNIIQVPNYLSYVVPIVVGGLVIVITGLIDDIKEIRPWQKSIGILIASLVIYIFSDIHFDTFSIPGILQTVYLDWWLSAPLTIIWIFSLTNAVNLIDGLDGLASGVSVISLSTIGIVGYFFLPAQSVFIPITIFTMVAAILGFFPYNFHPAKIYLGDTGALLLGFMIAVLSLQGLKNATFVAVLTPMFVLGVPITDTLFAIIRRKLNNQPMSSPDRSHLHHRLLSLGFSQRSAVLTIYCISIVFSFIALLMSYASRTALIFLVLATFLGVEIFVELVGVLGEHTPMLKLLNAIGDRERRLRLLKKNKDEEDD